MNGIMVGNQQPLLYRKCARIGTWKPWNLVTYVYVCIFCGAGRPYDELSFWRYNFSLAFWRTKILWRTFVENHYLFSFLAYLKIFSMNYWVIFWNFWHLTTLFRKKFLEIWIVSFWKKRIKIFYHFRHCANKKVYIIKFTLWKTWEIEKSHATFNKCSPQGYLTQFLRLHFSVSHSVV